MLQAGGMSFAELTDRGVLAVRGADARDFLQNLVTNDVSRVSAKRAVWAALLTPQGKYLHDFFIVGIGEDLMLDCEGARIDDLAARLNRYKLRASVEIADVSDQWVVAALMGGEGDARALVGFEGRGGPFAGGVCYVDPRYGGIGSRALLPRAALGSLAGAGFAAGTAEDYDHARLCAGLPDASRDLVPDKALPMENGFEQLRGIDWDKGCYVGQELTARMRYRGNAKRRLLPVAIEGGDAPEPGTPIMLGEREAGEMRSHRDGVGLALIRIDALKALHEEGGELTAEGAVIAPLRPPWLAVPDTGSDASATTTD